VSDSRLTIKLGGTAGTHAASLAVLVERARPGWVVVHGGGAEVGDWSRRLGLEPATVDGLRVTDTATLDVVVAVLRGLVNARLVATFAAGGVSAVGLSGADGNLLVAERFDPRLGEVGRVIRVRATLLDSLAAGGYVPVVAPIARASGSELLNVNADEVAGAIAAERGGRLLLLTDVPGVLMHGSPVRALTVEEAAVTLADETASGGMRPKLHAAMTAATAGCDVAIVNGTDPDAVRAALDGMPTGTTVTAARAARIG
jgi:acetylglutamate kinase